MKYAFHVSPNLQNRRSTSDIMRDLTIGLCVVFVCSMAYYWNLKGKGFDYILNALVLLVCSLATTFVCEAVFAKVKKKPVLDFIKHSYGWVTSLILVMMVPIYTPVYAVIVATFFAVAVARLMFGGFGQNIFNPAGVGRAVIFASFSGAVVRNLKITGATPTTILATTFNWLPASDDALHSFLAKVGGWAGLAIGDYPGAIGETFSVVILLVMIFLIVRKVIDWRMPVVYLGTIFVMTMVIALLTGIPTVDGVPGWLWYPMLHLLTGGVIFGAVFMLTDPVTIPTVPAGRVFFALCAAVITVLIRMKGNYSEGCLYSILIMNCFTPLIEQALDRPQFTQMKKASIMCLCAVVLAFAVSFYGSTAKPVRAEKDLNQTFSHLLSGGEQ